MENKSKIDQSFFVKSTYQRINVSTVRKINRSTNQRINNKYMDFVYSFEKLDVWHEARLLVKEIYQVAESFPKSEKYGLTNQIQRAYVSVVSNIAEGVSRFSPKEQIRFIEVAYGSLTEVYCQLMIAMDLDYINKDKLERLKPSILKISNQLNALKKSILKRNNC